MSRDVDSDDPRAAREGAPGLPLVRALLGVPLFYKILIGNAAVVVLGTAATGVLLLRILGDVDLTTALSALGMGVLLVVILSLLLNAALITLALRPLERIEQTARRVQAGDEHARTEISHLADRELRRLTRVFNEMLETLDRSRQREQELAVRLLEAEERERQRISRELYDDPAQRLATLLLRLQVAERQADTDARRGLFRELREEVAQALEGIRRSARRLRPPELDDLGLVSALRALTRTASELSGMEIGLEAAEELVSLDAEASLALYRVVQEAISNAAIHSDATRVTVGLFAEEGRCVGEVRDDGKGFDPATVLEHPRSGLGILAMKERASYVGGTVRVDTTPGGGTRVRVTVPCSGERGTGLGEAVAPAAPARRVPQPTTPA